MLPKLRFCLSVFFLSFASLLATSLHAAAIESLSELRKIARKTSPAEPHSLSLEATVLYASRATSELLLHDQTADAHLAIALNDSDLKPGDRITLSGSATLTPLADRIAVKAITLVDNDGLHGETESSNTIHLAAGYHPFRLEWFNAIGEPGLIVEMESPSLPRLRFPADLVFNDLPMSPDEPPSPGLNYKTYHGNWWALPPSLNALMPIDSGTTPGFDVSIAKQKEFVAIEFSGYLKIPETNNYTFYLLSDDGSRLFLEPSSLSIEKTASTPLPKPLFLAPGQTLPDSAAFTWTSVEGQVSQANLDDAQPYLLLSSGLGETRIHIANTTDLKSSDLLQKRILVTGSASPRKTFDGYSVLGDLYTQSAKQIQILPDPQATPLPISEVERLPDNKLDGRFLVRIQGVVTNPIPGGYALVMQDETRAIFVDLNRIRPAPILLGERIEIEGFVQAGEFSPFLNATKLTRLGLGVMPTPLVPTREEILNGSLHSQYVLIEGYVLALDQRTLTLRTRAGTLNVTLETSPTPDLLNAVLEIKGCLRSFWDPVTREIEIGKIELNSAAIQVTRKAPLDLFNVSKKQLSDLLKFDPYANVFQRSKITAQVLQQDKNQLYLLDDSHGFRATLSNEANFEPGDVVELVGFPEFDGPSPLFTHAIARLIGQNTLPEPTPLDASDALLDENDSTLVEVVGELLGMGLQDGRWTLQLRMGPHVFAAPLQGDSANPPSYEPGSELNIKGVFVGLGGNRSLGQSIEAFEILVDSPQSIQILSTPPWWNITRLILLLTALSIILLLALLWIKSLQRQVALKTDLLKTALEERHHVEQEEALNRERSRLAYDLHDELGAGLTEVGLLGTLAATESLPAEQRQGHLSRLSDKVRHLVMSLDEIVWAVNPKYDSISSFVSYYTFYAQQFLELAKLPCRFDVQEDLPELPLTSRVRHSLFLCFKEALNNIVRHAKATEVVVRISVNNDELRVTICDNGCGLGESIHNPGTDGLASIRDRLDNLGGRCELESNPNSGTIVRLILPLS